MWVWHRSCKLCYRCSVRRLWTRRQPDQRIPSTSQSRLRRCVCRSDRSRRRDRPRPEWRSWSDVDHQRTGDDRVPSERPTSCRGRLISRLLSRRLRRGLHIAARLRSRGSRRHWNHRPAAHRWPRRHHSARRLRRWRRRKRRDRPAARHGRPIHRQPTRRIAPSADPRRLGAAGTTRRCLAPRSERVLARPSWSVEARCPPSCARPVRSRSWCGVSRRRTDPGVVVARRRRRPRPCRVSRAGSTWSA